MKPFTKSYLQIMKAAKVVLLLMATWSLHRFNVILQNSESPGRGGGSTLLFGPYEDVPLDRVWFFGLADLNRVYDLTYVCPTQGQNLSKTGYGITSRETLTQIASMA